MIVTEHWAICNCGYRELVETPDTHPPGWPAMVDSDGRHYACTRGCLVQLMADPATDRKQIFPPLPFGMQSIDVRILELVGMGYTNSKIGFEMGRSGRTIRNRLRHVSKHLGAESRTHALLLAHARGLINLSRLARESAHRVDTAA